MACKGVTGRKDLCCPAALLLLMAAITHRAGPLPTNCWNAGYCRLKSLLELLGQTMDGVTTFFGFLGLIGLIAVVVIFLETMERRRQQRRQLDEWAQNVAAQKRQQEEARRQSVKDRHRAEQERQQEARRRQEEERRWEETRRQQEEEELRREDARRREEYARRRDKQVKEWADAIWKWWRRGSAMEEMEEEERRREETRRRQEEERRREETRRRQEEEQRQENARKQAKGRHGRNWWDVLGTARDATQDEVRAAYRQRIKLYHPDKVAALAPEFVQLAEQRSRELNAALAQALREVQR
jgi:hypothetical protein